MKKIFSLLMIMVVAIISSVGNVYAKDNFKKLTSINKNETKFETSMVDYYGNGFTAKLSLIVFIDTEAASADANIRVRIISDKRSEKYRDYVRITESAPLYVGRSGDEPTEFDAVEGHYRRYMTDGERYAAEAIYEIDDIEELWDANKIRVSTKNSWIDLEKSELRTVLKELKSEFEKKTLKKAEETFYRKTDPTFNF